MSIQPTAQPAVTVADPTRYTVRFGSDGSVSARVDCNRCGGRYRVDGRGPDHQSGAGLHPRRLRPAVAGEPVHRGPDQRFELRPAESELELVYAGGTLRFRAAP